MHPNNYFDLKTALYILQWHFVPRRSYCYALSQNTIAENKPSIFNQKTNGEHI